ncbi:MAG: PAS domain S-box protein [Rhodospirillales bacterium]|nr:MAG: PAS domain S-box protein [Rhodospirillales bacterium]
MPLIIVIDDRPERRRQILGLAASVTADVIVEGFATLGKAIESATAAPPDLVVVGRTMPAHNGVRAIRRFRKIAECEDTPIILLADREARQMRYRALEAGVSDVLADPPDPGEFALRARNLLAISNTLKSIKTRAELLERGLAAKERRYRRDLKATRNNLRGIIDTVPAIVSVADREGNFVFINQYLAAFVGKTPDEAIGAPIEDILGPAHGKREKAANAEVFRGVGTLSGYEEELTDATGMARTFLSTKSALRDEDNRVVNVITVAQDITFRKWVESELREAKDAAEAASRVKTEFLANVSHELRTPLNAIIGFAEGISDNSFGEPDLDRYREYTQHISRSAHHLKTIIDDILDIANFDSGGLEFAAAEADLAAALADAAASVESSAVAGGVTVQVDIASDPPAVRTDPDRLRQILAILLSYAVKSTPAGGQVRVELSLDEGGTARVSVGNGRAGIAANGLPRTRRRPRPSKDEPAAGPREGLGFGLPVSISLAELIGARVEIDRPEGSGARVSLLFPVADVVQRGRLAG